jgi:hypothetical protein
MKIRIKNYYLAYFIFRIIKVFWWNIIKRGTAFDKVIGIDWEEKVIDNYYLLNFK